MAQVGFVMPGTFSYNGYTFGAGTSIEEISTVPHRDEANRTVSYFETTINVQFVVADTSGTNSELESIRASLNQDGGELTYTGRGFGNDLIFNQGRLQDLRWGPKVNNLSWEPVGAENAALVNWSVTVAHNDCEFAIRDVLEHNVSISYAIQDGNTIRTITGYILIAQTRQGFGVANNRRNVPLSADEFLDRIQNIAPPGFKRSTSRTVSKDKSRLDYTLTDTQIASENPYPNDCISISAQESINWSVAQGGGNPKGSISCEITLAAGVRGARALQVFLANIALPRLRLMRRRIGIFVTAISMTESIFERTHNFRVNFEMLGVLKKLVTDHAMWEPVPGTNWIAWRNSLANDMFHGRGNAKLFDVGANDTIVELCDLDQPFTVGNRDDPPPRFSRPERLLGEKPPREESWVNFDAELITIADRPTAKVSVQQECDEFDKGAWELTTPAEGRGEVPIDPTEFPTIDGQDDQVTISGRTRYTHEFRCVMTRVGYHMCRPIVKKIGGQEAIPISHKEKEKVVGNSFGVPILQKACITQYYTLNSPETIYPVYNPKLAVNPESLRATEPQRG